MSGPAFIGSTYGGNANSVSRTPTAGNDLVLQIIGIGSPAVISGVTDSTGATVVADFAFTLSGSVGIGIYRVHSATAVNHTLTIAWSTAPSGGCYVTLNEASNVGGVDTAAGTPALATGTSATPTTGSLDPPASGDLLFATIAINHFLSSLGSLTNGFTQTQADVAGPSFIEAYLAQSTAASVNCGATANSSEPWAALLIAYKAPDITITPTTAPGGTEGVTYSQQFTAAGGTSPYAYSVSAGAVPTGLSLSSAGVLSGTPTSPGSYSFTIQAEDADSNIGTEPYSGVTIAGAPPTITSINSGNPVIQGAAGVQIIGVAFDSTLTLTAIQPGGVSVSLPVTYLSPTTATVNFSQSATEPSGTQLAYGAISIAPTTTGGGTGAALAATYLSPAGFPYVTLQNTSGIARIPGAAIGNQVQAAGNSTGSEVLPPGGLSSSGAYVFPSGYAQQPVWRRMYSFATKQWSAWTW